MKYIIIDWMSYICFGSDLKDFQDMDEASEWLDYCLRLEYAHTCENEACMCESMGVDGYSLEKLREDYYIVEYDESLDRIMLTGMRYVLKKDYYKGV